MTRRVFPKRKTIPAAWVGLSLTISEAALAEVREIDLEHALALHELCVNPILLD